MFKKIKQLFEVNATLTEMQTAIDKLSEQINQLATVKKPTRYHDMYINNATDYVQLREMFDTKYRKDAINKYSGIKNNLQDCIVQYDKALYFNKETINVVEVISKIHELEVLRSFILNILFKTEDVESFYLYAINNNTFYTTIANIPHIDMEKLFLLDKEKELAHDYYIIVNMLYDKIIVGTRNFDHEIENKYRKTVVRVLYSIYFERFFLYHLINDSRD